MSGANTNRVAGGLKATIHNPNTSEEAKASAQERLQNMGTEGELDQGARGSGAMAQQETGVLSDQISQGDLEEDYVDDEQQVDLTGNERGGYKATLKNPRVSSEAKEHAKEMLDADAST